MEWIEPYVLTAFGTLVSILLFTLIFLLFLIQFSQNKEEILHSPLDEEQGVEGNTTSFTFIERNWQQPLNEKLPQVTEFETAAIEEKIKKHVPIMTKNASDTIE